MTEDEARELAIRMGALEPQGLTEQMAANWMSSNGQRFSDTPLVSSRLEAWTRDILAGRDPKTGRPLG